MQRRTIHVYAHYLRSFRRILTTAEDFCAQTGRAPEEIMNARLAPHMQPLCLHVQLASDFATDSLDELVGRPPRKLAHSETDFAGLGQRLDKACVYLTSFQPEEFDFVGNQRIAVTVPSGPMTVSGISFMELFAKPQFFFHMTMAYAILRQIGVPLAETDFMQP
ncbi:DUF1993 family protein [Pararhodobacter zhoushanensis]|uniref:DUF1993 family protein n=1 Tax=Pararhodobacter zhoushanensis TaxID=2479545 RepID=UPI000F8F621F|nr:DUF1993 domain-containing protein [Pararhodobacter zhoushanensis]